MKQIPMMLQLTVILFCIMAIPVAILTSYSGTQILAYSEDEIAESSLAGLNANRDLFENALNNLAADTARLAATNIFDRVRNLESYEEVNSNYNNVSSALTVLRELANLNHVVDGVYSTYFHLDDSNYVISTDKGISKLDSYEPIDWMEEALVGRRGISGEWVPRKLSSGVNVVSYILPLNRLSTTTRGTIVVNLQESQISNYLRSSDSVEQDYYLLDSNGLIISHSDKSLLLQSGIELPFMQEIMNNPANEGYAFHETRDERLLYTWSRSPMYGWMNVKTYSMDELLAKTNALQRNILLITAIMMTAGAVITVLLATWVSKPVRELVKTVRSHPTLEIAHKKNELAFLDSAFKRMQEEEEELQKLLQERVQDTRNLAVQRLLRGELADPIPEVFPEPYYLVAVISIDRYRRYVSRNNPETRSYHRYLLIQKCEGMFREGLYAQTIYQGDGCFAIIMNFGQFEIEDEFQSIKEALAAIRDEAAKLLSHTVTIGVSDYTEASATLSDRMAEAMEVIKYRMIEGGGDIKFWKQGDEGNLKYVYPANSERRILNYLDMADIDSIVKELEIIRQEIRSARYISYDNILFIYHQLVGVTIRHLRENTGTARIFAGRSNIYSIISSFDTLDELEEYLREFYSQIVKHLEDGTNKAGYGERIIQYLEDNYCRDIIFEDMAKEIGISYSYMRKIVCEQTGKSLIDYINMLRIDKAKQLLLTTEHNIAQIASEVGYHNVQSFNRFFRKYEGIPPSNFRASKMTS